MGVSQFINQSWDDYYKKHPDAAYQKFLVSKEGRVSPDMFLKNLNVLQTSLKATIAGQLDPKISASIAQVLSEHGLSNTTLGDALKGGALTIPTTESMGLAGALAPELQAFQEAVVVAASGVPRAPSVAGGVVAGAASGFVAGGPVGAAAGAVAGFLGAKSGGRASEAAGNAVHQAALLASPENFAANMKAIMDKSREQTDIAGQQAELKGLAAESAAGARGTGIGLQTEISAGIAPEVAAIRGAAGSALQVQKQQLGAKLGATILPPPPDPLIRALSATAGIASQFGKRPATSGNSLPGDFNIPPIEQTVAEPF